MEHNVSQLVIVNNFHLCGTPLRPDKADAVPLVDANAELTSPVPAKGFKLVSRRNPKVVETHDRIQLVEFANGNGSEVSGARLARMPGVSTVEDILCPWTPEGHDHAMLIAWVPCDRKNGYIQAG
jgi:hypothetical protein